MSYHNFAVLSFTWKSELRKARINDKEKKRVEIITLVENIDKTKREIPAIVGLHESSVGRIRKQYEETGDVDLRYGNEKLEERDMQMLRKINCNNPRMTAADIQKEMGEEATECAYVLLK